MPRIPYLPADLAEPREIVDAVRARRGGTLLNLDRLLLYSPELAIGWNSYLGAVRTRLALSPKLRELGTDVMRLAELEGLGGHATSVDLRLQKIRRARREREAAREAEVEI